VDMEVAATAVVEADMGVAKEATAAVVMEAAVAVMEAARATTATEEAAVTTRVEMVVGEAATLAPTTVRVTVGVL